MSKLKCKDACDKDAVMILSWGYHDPNTHEMKVAKWPSCQEHARDTGKRLDSTRQVYVIKNV